ncbi:metalloregulator ArsR/SmtB family transcription factor [Streptomyces enissocaesilis]|uniref:Metalloregulator ArsR/SmtB family transcription factor n=1 Tax=Streptomyces enissocaesilis TaxID=332589 RepID=A0ABN3X4F9_9ACTN
MAISATDIPIEDLSEERCSPCTPGRLIDREEVELTASRLKALADPARLQMIHLIHQAPAGELCVCDLTTSMQLAQSTVSRHLKILVNAGFLRRQQRGTWAWFSLRPQALRELQQRVFPAMD